MAKQKQALVKKSETALTSWEQEEAAHAKDVKSKETLGVARITTRGGDFKIDGKNLGRTMVVLPIAAAKEKNFFLKKFDPNKPATPDCYAFIDDNREEKDMVAHLAAPHPQNRNPNGDESPCAGCKHNAFGTAEVGRGKRCKDYRRWLVIAPVMRDGVPFLDAEAVRAAEKRQIQIPPASLKNYGNYLAGLNDKTRTGSIREMIVQMELYALPQGGHGIKFTPVKGVDQKVHEAAVAVGNAALPMLTQAYPVLDSEGQEQPKERSKKSNKKLD